MNTHDNNSTEVKRVAFQQGFAAGVQATLTAVYQAGEAATHELAQRVPGQSISLRYTADVIMAAIRKPDGPFAEALKGEDAAWQESQKGATWK